MIRLEKVNKNNYKECLNLKVAEDQSQFLSTNLKSLALAYVFYDTVTPFAIYNNDLMVGFIMVRFNKEYKSYFIWQFMIDERYQSNGHGKRALKQAIEWMKKNERCTKITTTYKEGNDGAHRLYTQLGFEQMGEMIEGEVDMVLHI